jgi:hypothetical protein
LGSLGRLSGGFLEHSGEFRSFTQLGQFRIVGDYVQGVVVLQSFAEAGDSWNFPWSMQLWTPFGGEVAAKLIVKVKQGGSFGYASALPENAAAKNPTVKIACVLTRPDPSKVREFADDVRDGNSSCGACQRYTAQTDPAEAAA